MYSAFPISSLDEYNKCRGFGQSSPLKNEQIVQKSSSKSLGRNRTTKKSQCHGHYSDIFKKATRVIESTRYFQCFYVLAEVEQSRFHVVNIITMTLNRNAI